GIVLILVHAQDHRDVFILRRCGDDHLLRPGLDVGAGLGRIREEPGGLDDELDAKVLPRQVRRITLRQHLQLAPVDGDGAVGCLNVQVVHAVGGVILEQVGQGVRAGQVVDGDDLQRVVVLPDDGLEHLPANASEPIDPDTNSHFLPSYTTGARYAPRTVTWDSSDPLTGS